jgi:hypothetical protein
VGAHFAVARIRKERAFEKRLAWYELFHGELKNVMEALVQVIHTQRREGLTDNTRLLWQQLAQRLPAFGRAATDAEFYAPNKTLATVRKAVEDLASFRLGLPSREEDPQAWLDRAIQIRDLSEVIVLAAGRSRTCRARADGHSLLRRDTMPPGQSSDYLVLPNQRLKVGRGGRDRERVFLDCGRRRLKQAQSVRQNAAE